MMALRKNSSLATGPKPGRLEKRQQPEINSRIIYKYTNKYPTYCKSIEIHVLRRVKHEEIFKYNL